MVDVWVLAALGTAVSWTGSSVVFAMASRVTGGLAVNLFRILLAVPLLLVLHVACGLGAWPTGLDGRELGWLAASGIVGLVLGDIGYFHGLALVGPRVCSVMMATWPALAALMTLALGREPLTLHVGGGLLLTTAGIVLVLLRGGEGSAWNPSLTPSQRLSGTLGAFIGALGQAGGTVIARPVLSQPEVDPLSAALVRLCAAATALLLLAIVRGQLGLLPRVWNHHEARRAALAGTVFGPVLGVWMSMVAIGRAEHTGVAAALMALMPIFMMPVARWLYGARIGLLGVLGTVMAVAGAVWLLWRG